MFPLCKFPVGPGENGFINAPLISTKVRNLKKKKQQQNNPSFYTYRNWRFKEICCDLHKNERP
jgi:4-alpha-glucanotransferase